VLQIGPQAPPSAEPSAKVYPQFYRRQLPDTCVAFSSAPGRKVFESALASGGMQIFFPLSEQFRTQDEPVCDATSHPS